MASTYLIGYSHGLQNLLAGWLRWMGLEDLDARAVDAPAVPTHAGKDVVLLGFFVEASALVHEYELDVKSGRHLLLEHLLVIDFNPLVHEELIRRSIACVYGDISHLETLRHAEIRNATLIVSTIPDTILKGTNNLELLRKSRQLCPRGKVIVTAIRTALALELYEAGADYVFMPGLQSAAQMASILAEGLEHGFARLRAEHIEQLRRRNEVLQ